MLAGQRTKGRKRETSRRKDSFPKERKRTHVSTGNGTELGREEKDVLVLQLGYTESKKGKEDERETLKGEKQKISSPSTSSPFFAKFRAEALTNISPRDCMTAQTILPTSMSSQEEKEQETRVKSAAIRETPLHFVPLLVASSSSRCFTHKP